TLAFSVMISRLPIGAPDGSTAPDRSTGVTSLGRGPISSGLSMRGRHVPVVSALSGSGSVLFPEVVDMLEGPRPGGESPRPAV
ncbi:MAG: hypothetical protein ACKOSO_12000, partial [Actinomycetota bacterium]